MNKPILKTMKCHSCNLPFIGHIDSKSCSLCRSILVLRERIIQLEAVMLAVQTDIDDELSTKKYPLYTRSLLQSYSEYLSTKLKEGSEK